MSVTRIRTSVDHRDFLKGDVVIVKRSYFITGAKAGLQLKTICTSCNQMFPVEFRRMGRIGSSRACEVRNIPQCQSCRSKYRDAKRLAKVVDAVLLEQQLEAAANEGMPHRCEDNCE